MSMPLVHTENCDCVACILDKESAQAVVSRDWILACDGSNPEYPFGFACIRCGVKERLPLELPLDAYRAWGESFAVHHQQCGITRDRQIGLSRKRP